MELLPTTPSSSPVTRHGLITAPRKTGDRLPGEKDFLPPLYPSCHLDALSSQSTELLHLTPKPPASCPLSTLLIPEETPAGRLPSHFWILPRPNDEYKLDVHRLGSPFVDVDCVIAVALASRQSGGFRLLFGVPWCPHAKVLRQRQRGTANQKQPIQENTASRKERTGINDRKPRKSREEQETGKPPSPPVTKKTSRIQYSGNALFLRVGLLFFRPQPCRQEFQQRSLEHNLLIDLRGHRTPSPSRWLGFLPS